MAAGDIADLFQVFFPDGISGVSHRDLIEHPLIDCAGFRHGVRVLV